MQILYPFKVFMPLRTRSVLLAFKNAFKCNKAFPQRFAGDLQAFMANALFCQLNMTSPHLANGNGVEKWWRDGGGLHPKSKPDRCDRRFLHKMQKCDVVGGNAFRVVLWGDAAAVAAVDVAAGALATCNANTLPPGSVVFAARALFNCEFCSFARLASFYDALKPNWVAPRFSPFPACQLHELSLEAYAPYRLQLRIGARFKFLAWARAWPQKFLCPCAMASSCCLSTHNARIIMRRLAGAGWGAAAPDGGRKSGRIRSDGAWALNRFDLSNTPDIPSSYPFLPFWKPSKDSIHFFGLHFVISSD